MTTGHVNIRKDATKNQRKSHEEGLGALGFWLYELAFITGLASSSDILGPDSAAAARGVSRALAMQFNQKFGQLAAIGALVVSHA